jgi:hypothetical protein
MKRKQREQKGLLSDRAVIERFNQITGANAATSDELNKRQERDKPPFKNPPRFPAVESAEEL